jgi:large subunit ribosomal protein L30e
MARKKADDATLSKAIRMCVDTGKVEMGERSVRSRILLGKAKVVLVSSNCPPSLVSDLEHYSKLSGTPIIKFEGDSRELGSVCGKPFVVSSLAVLDSGNSNILEFAKK